MTGPRVPGLDGIRGLAIILVLVAHLAGLNGAGLVGVLIFFVLSGYLITTLLLRESDKNGSFDLARFYTRRALRLLPALVLLLGFMGILSLSPATGVTPADAARGAVQGLFYVIDFTLGFQMNFAPQLAHLWTLAVEEQFYVIWPVILMFIVRRTSPARRLRVLAWLLGVGAALRIMTLLVSLRFDFFFYALPTTWIDTLLVGCALAVVMRSDSQNCVRIRRLAGHPAAPVLALVIVLIVSAHPDSFLSPFTYLVGLPVLALSAAALIAAVVSDARSYSARLLGHRTLRWFGHHSYGLYLFNSTLILVLGHLIGHGLASRAAGVAAALLCAMASRRFVEEPALTLKHRLGRPKATLLP